MTHPREIERLYEFVNNAAVQDIKAELASDKPVPTPRKKEPTVPSSTTEKPAEKNAAPKFDPAAFLGAIQEADEPIKRTRGASEKYANNPYVAHLDKSRKSGKPLQLPVPGHSVKELVSYLRDAAEKGGHGLKLAVPKDHATDHTPVVVRFQAVEKRAHKPREKASKAQCPVCKQEVTVTSDGTLRKHGPRDQRCTGSGSAVSGE